MNRTAVIILGGVFVLLISGLFFSNVDFSFYTQQVSNPEASTGTLTDNQAVLLFLIIGGVLAHIIGFGGTLYGVLWFFNREVRRAQDSPNEPFPLLAEGAAEGVTLDRSLLINNAVYIVVGLGVLMVAVTLLVLLVA